MKDQKPISGDTGLKDIERIAAEKSFSPVSQPGSYRTEDTRQAYVKHLLTYIDASVLKPLKIVCNAGNGGRRSRH